MFDLTFQVSSLHITSVLWAVGEEGRWFRKSRRPIVTLLSSESLGNGCNDWSVMDGGAPHSARGKDRMNLLEKEYLKCLLRDGYKWRDLRKFKKEKGLGIVRCRTLFVYNNYSSFKQKNYDRNKNPLNARLYNGRLKILRPSVSIWWCILRKYTEGLSVIDNAFF